MDNIAAVILLYRQVTGSAPYNAPLKTAKHGYNLSFGCSTLYNKIHNALYNRSRTFTHLISHRNTACHWYTHIMNGVPASADCFDWLLINYMRICLHSFTMKEGRVTWAFATNFDWSLEMFTTRCVRVTVKVGHTHAICY